MLLGRERALMGRKTCEIWAWCRKSELDGDGFDFGVIVECFCSHFAAPARLLEAAEGESGVENVVAVDPDGAGA